MDRKEFSHIALAVLVMFVIIGARFFLTGDLVYTVYSFITAAVVISIPIIVKNAVAYSLDSKVEHRIWNFQRFGFRPKERFKNELPFGVIVPILVGFLSLGLWKVMTFLSYETRALKHRAARRFGFYSYTTMTDWHNGLIGASGVVSLLIVSTLSYLSGAEFVSRIAIYYAFWSMVPISNLDGTQIFFGSRVLWTVLSVVTLVFVFYSFVI